MRFSNTRSIEATRALICAALLIGLLNSAEARVFKLVSMAGAPFGFTSDTGKPIDIGVEIGNLILEEAGLTFENTIVPYARAVAMIESGDADFMLAFPNARFQAAAAPTASIAAFENVIIGRAGTAFPTLKELHGKTVASIRVARYDKAFSADPLIEKHYVNNYEQGLTMLLAGRVDAIIGTKTGILYQMDAMGRSRSQLGPPLILNTEDAWLFFSKRNYDEQIAVKLREAISSLRARGALQKILFKYFANPDPLPR